MLVLSETDYLRELWVFDSVGARTLHHLPCRMTMTMTDVLVKVQEVLWRHENASRYFTFFLAHSSATHLDMFSPMMWIGRRCLAFNRLPEELELHPSRALGAIVVLESGLVDEMRHISRSYFNSDAKGYRSEASDEHPTFFRDVEPESGWEYRKLDIRSIEAGWEYRKWDIRSS